MNDEQSIADINIEKRLKMIKNLDVKSYLEELGDIDIEKISFIPNEDQALMILHKARYFLARQGHLDKKYMRDSRQWLLSNGVKLPNV